MNNIDHIVLRGIADRQNELTKEQNRLLMCIGCALDKIADKLEAIEMSVRKN